MIAMRSFLALGFVSCWTFAAWADDAAAPDVPPPPPAVDAAVDVPPVPPAPGADAEAPPAPPAAEVAPALNNDIESPSDIPLPAIEEPAVQKADAAQKPAPVQKEAAVQKGSPVQKECVCKPPAATRTISKNIYKVECKEVCLAGCCGSQSRCVKQLFKATEKVEVPANRCLLSGRCGACGGEAKAPEQKATTVRRGLLRAR